jgi:hypothetical protein
MARARIQKKCDPSHSRLRRRNIAALTRPSVGSLIGTVERRRSVLCSPPSVALKSAIAFSRCYRGIKIKPCGHRASHGAYLRNLLPQIRQPNIGAVNLFSTLAGAPISRTTSEQYFAKAIDSMAEAFRRSPCSPSLLGPGYRQCTLEQKMIANLD